MNKDRSLLFGMLAVSMKKVGAEKMSEVARRAETDPGFDLGASLVEQGLITPVDKEQIDSLLEMSLAEHGGDATKTLQAFGKNPNKIDTFLDSMDGFVAAFEENVAKPAPEGNTDADIADSILGNLDAPDSFADGGPLELDSLVADLDEDPARTRLTQSGQTSDKASIGDIAVGDAPDSFFESIGHTDTQIMSPVQAAAEIDESEIVPAVSEHHGRYETIREFAKGGMGQITLVHDTHLGRDVALKQLLQRNIMPETRPGAPTTAILTIPIIARFLQEARITGQLEHPSIIPVYELGYRADGSLYYTMKLIRGQSMHDVLKDCKDIRDRMKMLPHFLDLCQAISYAHSRGVIHRDLKPMNLMIGEFGETVVIDWGIAKVKGQDDIHERGLRETVQAMRVSSTEATAKTMYGQTIGSPYFMPAEQAMGRIDQIDERSDIYSLGAVLYVILTGQMPYAGNNVREFMGKVGQVEPKPVTALEPNAPPELAAIVQKAMALVPENRYQSAKELTAEIEAFISGGMVSAYDYSLTEMIKRFYKKHKKVLNTMAAAAVIIIAGSVFYGISLKIAKDEAVAAEKVATEQKDIAEKKTVEAEEARADAEDQREHARQQLYYANIANTKFNINEQQMAKARELLATQETAKYRDWEWGFLQAEAHGDLMTLNRGGQMAVFTQGGKGMLTGTNLGSVSLHDLATGEVVHEFLFKSGYETAVAASADGARVAALEDKALHVWDVESREELLRFDDPKPRNVKHFMAFSANGKYVAGLNGDFTLRVWDVDSKEMVAEIDDCNPNNFGVFLSPDGSRMLVARTPLGEARRFEVFSVPGGEVIGMHEMPEDSVLSVHAAAFSPDNKSLALGTDNSLWIWTVDNLKEVKEFVGLRYYIPGGIAFSPDGQYVAAGTNEGHISLYSVSDGNATHVNQGHESIIRGLEFSPDGRRFATVGSDRTVRLWSVPGLQLLRTYRGHDTDVFTIAFNGDGTQMVSSSQGGRAKIWDVSSDLEFAPAELDGFTAVVYSPASGLVAGAIAGQVLIWDARTGRRVRELSAPGEAAKAMRFNTAGNLLASVSRDGQADVLRTWDLESGAEQFSFPTGTADTLALDFVHGDREILLKASSELVRIDSSGTVQALLPDNTAVEGKTLSGYAVSSDGNRLAVGFLGKEKTATLFLVSLEGDATATSIDLSDVMGVTPYFSPNPEKILVTTWNQLELGKAIGSIRYWDVAQNSMGTMASEHKNEILCVAFSRVGNLLATGDRNRIAAVWNADTLELVSVLRGHAGTIYEMDFSPDGKRLVTGSSDSTFKIWEVAGGKQLLTVNDVGSAVKSQGATASVKVFIPEQVTFSEDGLELATLMSPPASPMILHAFSWNMSEYPEAPATPAAEAGEAAQDSDSAEAALEQFEARMEAYKRQYWK